MRSPVVLVQYAGEADHFAGVEEALQRLGIPAVRMDQDRAAVLVEHRAAPVVAVKDTSSPLAQDALRRARALDAATVLVMDGIVESRNTLRNPFVEAGFLRPAPVDVVCCAGRADRERLVAWGNRVVATGLPRLDSSRSRGLRTGGVLIATAKRAYFDAGERSRLVAALVGLKDAAAKAKVPLIWRLTSGLDAELEIDNDPRPLGECLAEASAVITTPSTLLLEAMLADVPTGILFPFDAELWQESPWIWRGGCGGHRGDGAMEFLGSLREARAADLELQRATLARHHPSDSDAGARVAQVIADLVRRGVTGAARGEIASWTRIPAPRLRTARPRVVNMVSVEGSPVGGVMSWALRLAKRFARADLGYDVRTLVVGIGPEGVNDGGFELDPDGLTDVCIVDPFADHAARVRAVADSLARLEPSIVLPNYNDLCWMAAMLDRRRGSRTVAIGHTDETYYRDLAATYGGWEAGVAVSAAVRAWMEPLAADMGGRHVGVIPYGPPVLERPRELPEHGSLHLAYFGRMVRVQKRAPDLLTLAERLDARGVPFRLSLVGDGPELPGMRARAAEMNLTHGVLRFFGRRDVSWVEQFLAAPDGPDTSVLVSEFEGASVSMLEAMGAGVVPAVTRVSSGVDDWLRDGENGVVVPPPDEAGKHLDVMADRLAALWKAPGMRRALGRAAWETVRTRAGPDIVAKQYASVFDRVMASPRSVWRCDAGVRPMDLWRWNKVWCDAPAEADALCAQAVGADGIVVASTSRPWTPETVEQRRRTRRVAVSPHLRADTLEDRVRAIVWDAVLRLRAGGREGRVAVYGLGQHTRRMPGLFDERRWAEVMGRPFSSPFVGFIDDAPPEWTEFHALPIVTLVRAFTLRPDAILLSSDRFEDAMFERCADLRSAGVETLRVYGVAGARLPTSV